MELESGKLPRFSRFTIWNPSGAVASTGALAQGTRSGPGYYSFPLGLQITAGGQALTYGFSYTGGATGYFVDPATNAAAVPLVEFSGPQYSTLIGGDRMVGVTSRVAVGVQQAGSLTNPFDPWLTFNGMPGNYVLRDIDASADGSVLALTASDGPMARMTTPSYLHLSKYASVLGQPVDDCYVEQLSTTRARMPSLSADGARVAWQDAGGVRIAGVPNFAVGGPPSASCRRQRRRSRRPGRTRRSGASTLRH